VGQRVASSGYAYFPGEAGVTFSLEELGLEGVVKFLCG
jgi:hypothetical protein